VRLREARVMYSGHSMPLQGLGSSCGCGSIQKAGGTQADLSALGDLTSAVNPATGNLVFDAILGAAIGFIGTPDESRRAHWAVGGAAVAALLGSFGLGSLVGAAVYANATKRA